MKTILVDAADTFTVDSPNGFIVDEKMRILLDEYQNQKIIVTNADNQQLTAFGLTGLPYELFTLKHSPDKPDPVYFQKLLEKYDLNANDVIYFEHDAEAVESATSVDITSFHFNHELRDYNSLKAFIDSNL